MIFIIFVAKYNKYLASGPPLGVQNEASLGASTQIGSIDLDHQIKNDDFVGGFHHFLPNTMSIWPLGLPPGIENEANLGASTQIESIDLDHQIKNYDF